MKKRILMVVGMALSLMNCGDCGNETHVGSVVAVGQTGAFCKTWEAEIIRGGLNNGSGGVSATAFSFTIEDPKLLDMVQDAFDKQYEIKVSAHDEALSFCRSDASSRFATRIERMSNPGHPLQLAPQSDPKAQERERLLKQLKELDSK